MAAAEQAVLSVGVERERERFAESYDRRPELLRKKKTSPAVEVQSPLSARYETGRLLSVGEDAVRG